MTRIPDLETERLLLRELGAADLAAAHRILTAGFPDDPPVSLEARRTWLHWTMLSYEQLALLHQPPYGERAIVLRRTHECVGLVGLVPSLMPFGILPSLADPGVTPERGYTPEVGMFWAVAPEQQRRGYASEAAGTLLGFALDVLRLKRIVATTEHANVGSQGVMRKLGMRLERNPGAAPPWMQVVGIRDNA